MTILRRIISHAFRLRLGLIRLAWLRSFRLILSTGVYRWLEHYDVRTLGNMGALAAGCIRHAFGRLLCQGEPLIHFPGNLVTEVWKLRRVSTSLGREPSLSELAREMQVSDVHLLEVMRVEERMRVESLPMLSLGDEAASEEPANITLLCSVEVIDGARQREAETMLWHGLNGVLTAWQREVVLRYHGLEDYAPQTFEEIASAFGVQERLGHSTVAMTLVRLCRHFLEEICATSTSLM